ncbi:extracellular solute-binding protein [Eubacteriales bacterium OttesenSCG-928-N13]|nr:extracellular solute-binding protein [Eubacteriales bacterium OttesenSCG-928-N13]
MKKLCLLLSLCLMLSCVFVTANAESSALTIYYGATLEQMTPVLDAFSALHPEIEIKSYRAANEELSATMEMELRSGNPQFDVAIQGNGPIISLQSKHDCFAPFTPEASDAIASSLLDPNGVMMPVGTGFYVIIYNTNQVTAEDAPTSFKDLLDPKWDSKVVMADPTSSSSVYTFIWMITQHLDEAEYGWSYFDKLQAQNVNYVASHGTIGELVSMGERSVGVQVMATAGTSLRRGDPIAIVYPEEGMPSEVNVGVIRKDSPNQANAELFMNFLMSDEGQKLVAENLGWIPVRTDMPDYALADGTLLSDIQLIPRDVEWVTDHKTEVQEKFIEIMG